MAQLPPEQLHAMAEAFGADVPTASSAAAR